ncbi:VCBS repeat-containing protein, partial [Candidatus Woesearchaeota archaeon]|nr:VCBS repeat-containing protein [Candidatus Woesearchaeota archaeon]
MSKKKGIVAALVLFSLLFSLFAYAAEEYKPYLHKAIVPQHPKLELTSAYKTELFPGAATFTYPLSFPPGTNGLTPEISLYYNSQTAKQRPSIVGAGWSLTQNYIYRDVNGTFNDTNDDIFKLVLDNSAQEIVNLNGTFKTEVESYARIQNLSGAPNTNGEYWILIQKDGTRYTFGYTNGTESNSNLGYNYTVRWSLYLIEDAFGNFINFSYLEDPFPDDTGAVYLSSIAYSRDEKRKIAFSYENETRPDRRLVYENGLRIEESRRLSNILVYANDGFVRRYQISYFELDGMGSLSSIANISQFGSDNISKGYSTSFSYHPDKEGYTRYNSSYIHSPLFADAEGRDYGTRLVDINNDGFIDLVKGRQESSERKTYLNNRQDNWTEIDELIVPGYITNNLFQDLGMRFANLNKDGFVDLIQGTTIGSLKRAWLNNGTAWVLNDAFAPPDYFGSETADYGFQIVDLNNDGKDDLLRGQDIYRKAWLNNGTGWQEVSDMWKPPVEFTSGTVDSGARLLDVNGDGLPDIIKAKGGEREAWLNNGSGWSNESAFRPPIDFASGGKPDHGARFSDLNGDGLPDILEDFENGTEVVGRAWLNNGSGWVRNDTWQSPSPFTKSGKNRGRRLGDINGDGFADVVVAGVNDSGVVELFVDVKNTSSAYLLRSITNGFGGVIEINYSAATQFNNSPDGTSGLGFNIWVVDEVMQNNSLAGEFNTIGVFNYTYFGGKFNSTLGEFFGFAVVNETRPDKSMVSHYFHQSEPLKGREYKTEIWNDTVNATNATRYLFSRSENAFDYTYNGSYQVFLANSIYSLFDGSNESKKTNASYYYDSYGNAIARNQLGDIEKQGDEKYERWEYAYSTNNDSYIVDKPILYQIYNSD